MPMLSTAKLRCRGGAEIYSMDS